jgi:AraC-like DNA-binding protein
MIDLPYKRKLYVYSVTLSLVPVLTLGLVSSYVSTTSVQEEVERNHKIILKQLETQVDSFLFSLDQASLQLSNNGVILKSLEGGITKDRVESALSMVDVIEKTIGYSNVNFEVSLYFKKFGMVYSSRYGMIRELFAPYSEIVQSGTIKPFMATIIPPHTYTNVSDMMLVRTVPLQSSNPDGYVIMHLDMNKIKVYLSRLDLGANRKIWILDEKGVVVTSNEEKDIGTQLTPDSELYPYLNNLLLSGSVTLGGDQLRASSFKSSFNGWTYMALTPTRELRSKSDDIRNLMLVIMGILFIVWGLVAFYGTRRLYFPIQRLIRKLSTVEDHSVKDEIQVIDTFMSRVMATNEDLKTELSHHLQESMLQRLLHGEVGETEFRHFVTQYEVPLQGSWFFVCVIDVDQYAAFQQAYKEKDRSLMMYALCNLIEELSQPLPSYVTVSPKPGQVVLIIGLQSISVQTAETIGQISRNIRESVKSYFSFTVSTVVSNARQEYASINESYLEAMERLEYRWMLGPNRDITSDELEPSLKRSYRQLFEWKNAVMDSIKQGEYDKARSSLQQLVEAVPRSLHHSDATLGFFSYMIGEIDLFLGERGYTLNDHFEYDVLEHLYGLTSLSEVHTWLSEIIVPAVEHLIRSQNLSKKKQIVPQMIEYIHTHYETDLSLQQMSDHFGVSIPVLSKMFKEEAGLNYLDYLIRFRMEKAGEWLMNTDMPIKEITDRLRYTTVQNFSRIFKQVIGVPPGNFRKMHRGD